MNRLFRRLAAIFFITFICLPASLSQTIDYSVSSEIVGSRAFVAHDMKLLSDSALLKLEIPEDAKELTLEINNVSAPADAEDGILQISLKKAEAAKVMYISGISTETPDEFLADFRMPADVRNLKVKVALPEQAVLRKPLSEGGSVFPSASRIETDGLQLYVTWTAQDLKKDDRFGAFVLYKSKKGTSPWVYAVIGLLVLLAAVLALRKAKKLRKRKVVAAGRPAKRIQEKIESHLKEDEKQIVSVLEQREGQCEQGTLRVVTGISKASLSRLLMELEARNVIYKEKRGKKNLIFLK